MRCPHGLAEPARCAFCDLDAIDEILGEANAAKEAMMPLPLATLEILIRDKVRLPPGWTWLGSEEDGRPTLPRVPSALDPSRPGQPDGMFSPESMVVAIKVPRGDRGAGLYAIRLKAMHLSLPPGALLAWLQKHADRILREEDSFEVPMAALEGQPIKRFHSEEVVFDIPLESLWDGA